MDEVLLQGTAQQFEVPVRIVEWFMNVSPTLTDEKTNFVIHKNIYRQSLVDFASLKSFLWNKKDFLLQSLDSSLKTFASVHFLNS